MAPLACSFRPSPHPTPTQLVEWVSTVAAGRARPLSAGAHRVSQEVSSASPLLLKPAPPVPLGYSTKSPSSPRFAIAFSGGWRISTPGGSQLRVP